MQYLLHILTLVVSLQISSTHAIQLDTAKDLIEEYSWRLDEYIFDYCDEFEKRKLNDDTSAIRFECWYTDRGFLGIDVYKIIYKTDTISVLDVEIVHAEIVNPKTFVWPDSVLYVD